MKHVFIIGSKGIPANYGGFETFVEKLTEKKKSEDIKYYVSCLNQNQPELQHNNSLCFGINVSDIGSAKAIIYDVKSLKYSIKYIEENNIQEAVVYILACRIGPIIGFYKRKLQKLGVKLYLNPDGHEWKRSKWNSFVKKYWKLSEKLMIKHADLVICDSIGIEDYIKKEYDKYNPITTFVPYGADIADIDYSNDSSLNDWYNKFSIKKDNYYLIVGRFVSENNYETIISEFMKTKTTKDLVIITNVEKNKFYNYLKEKTNFEKDKRIKFVGTVYDQNLLTLIRKNAKAYIHGHEVGGTNPSLLEALASTDVNILYDVNFNREVAEDSALYFNKTIMDLYKIINIVENMTSKEIINLGIKAKSRIYNNYKWEDIVRNYELLFLNGEIQ